MQAAESHLDMNISMFSVATALPAVTDCGVRQSRQEPKSWSRMKKSGAVSLLCSVALIIANISAVAGQTKVPPSREPTYLHSIDPYGIEQAIESGDSDKLKALRQKALSPIMHAYVLAAYYRSVFQLERSSKYAEQCYNGSIKKLPKSTVEALRCGELLAGNYAISGHTAAWARSMQTVRDKLYPIAASSLHTTDVVFPGFGTITHRINMHSFYDFPDEAIKGNEGSNIVVPRVLPSGEPPSPNAFKTTVCRLGIRCFGKYLYNINVNVDGHHIVAVIDTGSTTTVVPPSEANLLGVHMDPSPYYELQSSQSARSPAHLGYVGSIKIRTKDGRYIVLKNSNVKIGGQLTHDIEMVLGLNVLRELGSVLLKKGDIVINPNHLDMDCNVPLQIASDMFGGYSVFVKYAVDGSMQKVMLDTGENQYLFGTSLSTAKSISSQEMITHKERGTGDIEAIYHPAKIAFGKGAHGKNTTIAIFPGYEQKYPYVAGSDILQDYNIYLNFKDGRACLIPLS